MSDIRFDLNMDDFNRDLKKIAGGVASAILPALTTEAELIMTDAKKNTPVDTGALRSSGLVTAKSNAVELSFGGAASQYAAIVHERLDLHHPVGEAKFLENALNRWRSSGGFDRLGARIKKAME